MSILFTSIKWKNFLSTGNVFTELNLQKSGTTLIIGENGSGKSTMLDALTFGLFGKPFRNINKPQLMNSITKKDLVVEIEFWCKSNIYRIVRGIKPAIFEIYCNEKLVNQSSETKDYQDYLEKQILKFNFKSFCQVVVLGSASFVPFMQLTAAQRRAIIEDLLDLQVFTNMNVLLKSQIQENNSELQELTNEKKLITTKIEIVKEHMEEVRQRGEIFIAEKQKQINSFVNKVNDEGLHISNYTKHLEEKQKKLSDKESIQKRIDDLKNIHNQLDTKKSILKKEIEFFEKHENCPTCKQTIENIFKDKAVESKKEQIREIEDAIVKLLEKYNLAKEKNEELNTIQKEVYELQQKISSFKFNINHWNQQIKQYEEEIENSKNSIEKNSNDKIADLEIQLVKISDKFNELHDDKKALSFVASMLKDEGIKTKIINQYIPIINNLINKYLTMMDFFVSFEMNNEFEETIKSRYRDDFSYASFSEGEKQKIDLALLFTWRAIAKLRNSVNSNLLIMDEVFDSSLDSSGTDQLMTIIQSLTSDTNLFVISHKEQMVDKFNNIIRFKKHKNFSQMESLV
jgi:DNA repair exonuclease SbcCD ATPase subunit